MLGISDATIFGFVSNFAYRSRIYRSDVRPHACHFGLATMFMDEAFQSKARSAQMATNAQGGTVARDYHGLIHP
jgi:hypothetical protein